MNGHCKLSVLNFSSNPREAIALAKLCDDLTCFERFWVGEHHSDMQIPDALAFALVAAGTTDRIRIGTGAVSLVLRNPYLVAETALTAELLHPNRIDLGVARSIPIGDSGLERLLDGDLVQLTKLYDDRLRTLRDLLVREGDGGPFFLQEVLSRGPAMYVMGVGEFRARTAAQLGIGFVSSLHHGVSVRNVAKMMDIYRDEFRPSLLFAQPYGIVVVSGFISDDLGQLQEVTRHIGSLPVADCNDETRIRVFGQSMQCAARLRHLADDARADEVMFLSLSSTEQCGDCYLALAAGWMGGS